MQDKKQQKDQTSSKARKNLSLLKHAEWSEPLDLKKAMVQRILKKQRFNRIPQIPLSQKKALQYGFCGKKAQLYSRKYASEVKRLSQDESEKESKILLEGKRTRGLHIVFNARVPIRVLKSIEAMRNLQVLKLTLLTSQFLLFSRILRSLSSLRKLSLTILEFDWTEKVTEKDTETAVFQFSQYLLTRKSLRYLRLEIRNIKFMRSGTTRTYLLNMLNELNLSEFQVFLPVSRTMDLCTNSIQPFLKKVEYLCYWETLQTSPHNKLLGLVGMRFSNFPEILKKCSSLKGLDFPLLLVLGNIPTSLGLAKGITDFKITDLCIGGGRTFSEISRLISEASNLESFSLQVYHLQQPLILIHNDLKNLKIRKYSLCLISYGQSFKDDTLPLKELCWQIGQIQSLEELNLEFGRIEDGKSFERLFTKTSLPNLKVLSIKTKKVDKVSSNFPYKYLSLLPAVEEIYIDYIGTNTDEVLERFPEIPSLKKLKIQNSEYQRNPLTKKFDQRPNI